MSINHYKWIKNDAKIRKVKKMSKTHTAKQIAYALNTSESSIKYGKKKLNIETYPLAMDDPFLFLGEDKIKHGGILFFWVEPYKKYYTVNEIFAEIKECNVPVLTLRSRLSAYVTKGGNRLGVWDSIITPAIPRTKKMDPIKRAYDKFNIATIWPAGSLWRTAI